MENGFAPRVLTIAVGHNNARARVKFTAFERTWRFRKTDEGWRIDYFALPVRE